MTRRLTQRRNWKIYFVEPASLDTRPVLELAPNIAMDQRDHGIESEEAEECFFHDYMFAKDNRRFDDVYVLDAKTDRGRRLRLVSRTKAMDSREYSPAGT